MRDDVCEEQGRRKKDEGRRKKEERRREEGSRWLEEKEEKRNGHSLCLLSRESAGARVWGR